MPADLPDRIPPLRIEADMAFRTPSGPAARRLLGAALAALLAFAPAAAEAAEAVETGFVRKVFRDEAGEHGYVVYVPGGYTPDRAWPVMLFLHGAGERGDDGVRQSQVGLGAMIRRWGEFPWIVVFPQAEDTRAPIRSVWAPDAPDGRRALAILEEVERTYRTDPDHRVLTGWSMGGRGSYMLAAAFPEKWSAVVPVAGWADVELAEKLTDVPLWAFHGTEDTLVSYSEDKALVEAIRDAGGEPFFTTMPGRGHSIWRTVYASPVVFEWMSDPSRFAGRDEPPELDPLPEVELSREES
ncbi:MAG TPA: prolyl oligopeptidase family serine peptidase, partial [Planctomycetaceae bacterium]